MWWWLALLAIPIVWYVLNAKDSIKIAKPSGCSSCPKKQNDE